MLQSYCHLEMHTDKMIPDHRAVQRLYSGASIRLLRVASECISSGPPCRIKLCC